MRPEEADVAFLWHMLGAARTVQELLQGYDSDRYYEDRTKQLAVERGLEVIGEAARRVSRSFRNAHPEIPWRHIVAQRNIIAHWYYSLDQEKIWDSATVGVSELIALLEPLVPPPPPDPEPG